MDAVAAAYPSAEEANQVLKSHLGVLAGHVDESPFMSRALRKPRGYAGDYQLMNYIYDNKVLESPTNMGKFLNYYILACPGANAVRNRAKVIQGLIQQRLYTQQGELAVASIASGPPREVADTMALVDPNATVDRVRWTLLDQDEEALANARRNLPDDSRLTVEFINRSVRDLLKKTLVLPPQDVIYSLGLFDYLEEKVAISLIGRLYDCLKPGGIMLIGNMHPRNPVRLAIESFMEWFLIHRTEEEFLALGKKGAPAGRHFVIAEPEGINLILVTSKPLKYGVEVR